MRHPAYSNSLNKEIKSNGEFKFSLYENVYLDIEAVFIYLFLTSLSDPG